MRLKYCTITGADDAVEIEHLEALSMLYPFVEWGILLSKNNAGTPRYPSFEWIGSLDGGIRVPMNTSLHVCGSYYGDMFLDGHVPFEFKRIQLNGTPCCELDIDRLKKTVSDFGSRGIEVITQNFHTKLWKNSILFDKSKGRGHYPIQWPYPDMAAWGCGYAGGINPDNVEQTLVDLEKIVGDNKIWIDMESGVRTDNTFDLDKVEKVLKIAERWEIR